MHLDNDDLEKYLSDFRPRAPQELRTSQRTKSGWMGQAAAAALVLITVSLLLLYSDRRVQKTGADMAVLRDLRMEIRQTERPSLIVLTRLALADHREFEALLAKESRDTLPLVQKSGGALQILAKE
jgi:hypothetical protein